MSGSLLVLTIAGLLAGVYVLTLVVVAHLFTTPRRISPPRPPSESAHDVSRVAFRSRHDALQLVAWYHRAPDSTCAVIFVHGRDGCRGDELRNPTFRLAQRFVAQGISVLMLDLRGHGESDHARLTFGHHERYDVLGAVDFLLGRGYQPTRIGVLGASMGGASAIAAAAEEPAIGALVSDSAFADLDAVLRMQFTRLTRLPGCCLNGALFIARLLTGVHLTHNAPRLNMRRLRGRPSLVIHAACDPFVPVKHAHALARAGASRLWVTAGARHLASYRTAGAEYESVVADFFVEHLQPVSVPCAVYPAAFAPISRAGALRRIHS